jgi:hypothetical protein
MGEGTHGVVEAHVEHRGTTRAVETDGTGGERVHALGREITEVRERLDTLVDELDRRRHAALDWRGQLRRHALGLAMTALGLAALVSAGLALRAGAFSASRTRRRFRRG